MPTVVTKKTKHRSPKRVFTGEKDIVRVSPYRASWTCTCGHLNMVYFQRIINIGYVYNHGVVCSRCRLEFWAMSITDPMARRWGAPQ